MSSEESFTFVTTSIQVVLIPIGFIGNIFTIMIFLRKTFRNNSISTYCISLAIVECLAIFEFVNDIGYFTSKIKLNDQSDAGCKFFSMNATLIASIPPFIMVAFSVDKLLNMRTNSMQILKKKWFQWSLVAAIVLFHIALYICYPILLRRSEIFPGYFICDATTIGFFQIFMIVVIPETCFIPFLILITTSILTIRSLIKSRNSVERTGHVTKDRKSRDRKYAISSVVFNTIFIFLKLPSTISFTLFAFFSYYDAQFFSIADVFFFLNCSLGFFIHLVTNSLFKREFLVLFRLANRNETMSSKTTSRANIPIRLNQVFKNYFNIN